MLAGLIPGIVLAQPARPTLTVEQIMQAPAKWIGGSPAAPFWSWDGKQIYFRWNPERLRHDSLYVVAATGGASRKVPARAAARLPVAEGSYDYPRRQQVYSRDGDLFLLDLKTGTERRLTLTADAETNPVFVGSGPLIAFRRADNLYQFDPATGLLTQLTDLRRGSGPGRSTGDDGQRGVLKRQQQQLFDVLRQREADRLGARAFQKRLGAAGLKAPKPVYIGEQDVDELRVSPDGRFVTYRLITQPSSAEKLAQVPAFVTGSGYTEELPTRSKVGDRQMRFTLGIYDRQRDTAYTFSAKGLPGLLEKPDYLKEYPAALKDTTRHIRDLLPFGPFWSPDGRYALLTLRALDNKDRWLVLLDATKGAVQKTIDRQHDNAWIGGPGIDDEDSDRNLGWLDANTVWFHSEATGYSHLYAADVTTEQKMALTSGTFEVQLAVPPRPGAKWWYLVTNETDPGEKQVWRLPRLGGPRERITTEKGAYELYLSPDGQHAAARYSAANKPWELVTFELKPGARQQVLTHSTTKAFEAYPWRVPAVVTIKARDGQPVRARVYRPDAALKNGAAVVFVHGAGYLQNAHYWWSQYFREYQFHNLLADRGYTVIDVDYRGSAGYGRDFRTGIYRWMGGKDLNDEVDAAQWLVSQESIDARRIGIYGGSYGGFMTLMALFTQPDVFACGAALRSVTDWAHYNHGYTANILNTPQNDSLAYRRSSPIYFAEGLTKPLLICHGMVDTNVHFQDVVRLSQRLIELGKPDWEMAVYPVEDHAFVEPTSWADEYGRILKLFEAKLKK